LVTKLLHDAGYTTGLSGKLHISACHPSTGGHSERRIDDGYDQFFWSHDSAEIWNTNEYHQWVRRKGADGNSTESPHSPHIRTGPPAEHHQTTWCAEKAIEFIEESARFEQPWLFSVNMFDPHHPFDPPEAYLKRYLDRLDEIPLPTYAPGELEDKPQWQSIDHRGAYGGNAGLPYDEMSNRDHRVVRAAYWAMCDLIDDQVGRILDALEQSGQREETIVIFMSDHGEMLGDHGIYLKGPYFYEPAIRVPLIISWPGEFPPREDHSLVELTDIAPTLLEAAGLPPHPGMQGHSLLARLRGETEAAPAREDVYCEYYNAMPWHRDPTPQMTMVRTERYKIAVDHADSGGELYDLEADPAETHNRWEDPSYAEIKTGMLLRLSNRMAFTVDPLPERRAPW
jgi:arylsulfatase A-like enzyme